jgi:hypothetical protein
MPAQRAVHRLIAALAKLPHQGWVYRSEAVTRTGKVIESHLVRLDDICWC